MGVLTDLLEAQWEETGEWPEPADVEPDDRRVVGDLDEERDR